MRCNYGFNARTKEYENLVAAGVIALPGNVVRSALQSAAAVAALQLTTEAVAAAIGKENDDATMAHAGGQ